MTTNGERSGGDSVRAWAASQLRLPASPTPADSRAAILRAVAAADFVPEVIVAPAARLLLSPEAATTSGTLRLLYERHAQESVEVEIHALAAEFFELDQTERRRRHAQLRDQAAPFPPLAARLQRLERGLHIEQGPGRRLEGDIRELCANVCGLFTLPPLDAVARRRGLQAEWNAEPERWAAAAAGLAQQVPAVAGLEDALIDRLRLGVAIQEERARAAEPLPEPGWIERNPGTVFILGLIAVALSIWAVWASTGGQSKYRLDGWNPVKRGHGFVPFPAESGKP